MIVNGIYFDLFFSVCKFQPTVVHATCCASSSAEYIPKNCPSRGCKFLTDDALSVGICQPVTTAQERNEQNYTVFGLFNFMLVLRIVFSAVIYYLP